MIETEYDEAAADVGRRERKKREVRAALIEAALALFAEHGVDGTSVEAITDRVDVSPRTFHRYFAAKHDVLFADAEDRRQRFEAALAARPADEPLLASLAEAGAELAAAMSARPDHEARRQRIIDAEPELRARHLRRTEEWSGLIAGHAARRLGLQAGDPLPRVLGAATVAALRSAKGRWADDPSLDLAAEFRRCFGLLADLTAAVDDAAAADRPRRRRS